MRTEHKKIGDNIFQIVRADRGEYDIVQDEENGGWYVERIIAGLTMRSITYPCAQDAEIAIREKTVVCDLVVKIEA